MALMGEVKTDREAPSAILLAGPTASGKSALALELAERLGGSVINADSMQVYAELRILTARPSVEDVARAPHLLYGHVPMREGYSVGRWLDDARSALGAVRGEGRIPIFVGGTGLYFKALTEGLSPVPRVPEEVRARLRARMEAEGRLAMHAELALCDEAAAARIPASDGQRVLRALEVFAATGRALSAWQREGRGGGLVSSGTALRLVLCPPREELRANIDARVGRMLGEGALDEAAEVMRHDPPAGSPAMRAHGLRALIAHLRGELSLDVAAERTRAETRRYAKRQTTWIRHQMAGWEMVADPRDAGVLLPMGFRD